MTTYHTRNPEDKVPYTERTPPCPKCGSSKAERTYRCGRQHHMTPYWLDTWTGVEFLEVVCQTCKYSFPQEVKDENKSP